MTKPAPDQSIGTAAEAERAIASLNTIMDRLIETVEEESARMRKGHLRDALALDDAKAGIVTALRGGKRARQGDRKRASPARCRRRSPRCANGMRRSRPPCRPT